MGLVFIRRWMLLFYAFDFKYDKHNARPELSRRAVLCDLCISPVSSLVEMSLSWEAKRAVNMGLFYAVISAPCFIHPASRIMYLEFNIWFYAFILLSDLQVFPSGYTAGAVRVRSVPFCSLRQQPHLLILYKIQDQQD